MSLKNFSDLLIRWKTQSLDWTPNIMESIDVSFQEKPFNTNSKAS